MFIFEPFAYQVNICMDFHDEIEVPYPLAVEGLISNKLNEQQTKNSMGLYFPIFRMTRPSPLQGVTENDSS